MKATKDITQYQPWTEEARLHQKNSDPHKSFFPFVSSFVSAE